MGRFTGMTVLYLDLPNDGALAAFVARRYPQRLLGLAGLGTLPRGTGLLIPGCRSVHTLGMRFPLDVLFVALGPRSMEIVEVRSPVPPRHLARASRGGVGALEIGAGEAQRLALAPGLCLSHARARACLESERPADALREVPVPVAEQLHRRGHQ